MSRASPYAGTSHRWKGRRTLTSRPTLVCASSFTGSTRRFSRLWRERNETVTKNNLHLRPTRCILLEILIQGLAQMLRRVLGRVPSGRAPQVPARQVVAAFSTTANAHLAQTAATPSEPMPEEQFQFMRDILSAPSPVGLEASMTKGVIRPFFEQIGAEALGWREHAFVGNAGTVWDTAPDAAPGEKLTVMICGHADKIRMQVRSIGSDGKIWINSDSFLPLTLIGNKVTLFSEDKESLGTYRRLPATVEALGAIHFAPANMRSGSKGVGPQELYLELGMHGDKRKEQLDALGVQAGDTVLLDRPIERCAGGGAMTFSGSYLDNGLGCFVAAEVARMLAADPSIAEDVRVLFAFASVSGDL